MIQNRTELNMQGYFCFEGLAHKLVPFIYFQSCSFLGGNGDCELNRRKTRRKQRRQIYWLLSWQYIPSILLYIQWCLLRAALVWRQPNLNLISRPCQWQNTSPYSSNRPCLCAVCMSVCSKSSTMTQTSMCGTVRRRDEGVCVYVGLVGVCDSSICSRKVLCMWIRSLCVDSKIRSHGKAVCISVSTQVVFDQFFINRAITIQYHML